MKVQWQVRECQDKHALREDRLETVEWALLIFGILGAISIIPAIANEVIWLLK
jgi:hypothetical protein